MVQPSTRKISNLPTESLTLYGPYAGPGPSSPYDEREGTETRKVWKAQPDTPQRTVELAALEALQLQGWKGSHDWRAILDTIFAAAAFPNFKLTNKEDCEQLQSFLVSGIRTPEINELEFKRVQPTYRSDTRHLHDKYFSPTSSRSKDAINGTRMLANVRSSTAETVCQSLEIIWPVVLTHIRKNIAFAQKLKVSEEEVSFQILGKHLTMSETATSLLELYEAIGPARLADFVEARDRRRAKDAKVNGYPDLLTWRSGEYWFREVKSPNDRLQASQIEVINEILLPSEINFRILNVVS